MTFQGQRDSGSQRPGSGLGSTVQDPLDFLNAPTDGTNSALGCAGGDDFDLEKLDQIL